MRVTIKDIAGKTGLSTSTVSLVLNNKQHRLSEDTKARVWAAAQELGYRPNQLAKSLVTRKSSTIGLIVPDIANTFFAEIAKGAEAESQQNGYSVILCNTNNRPEQDVDYTNILLDRGIDGVIFVMSLSGYDDRAEECLALLQKMETPVVLVDRYFQGGTHINVLTNNEQGGYLATQHLLALGHRKIGCITGPRGGQSSQQRLFGYIRALQEYGVAFDPARVKEGDFGTDSAYLPTKELLEGGATAIFACNDMMAYGVYKQATREQVPVPRGLSIVGYDDLAFSEIMEIPLTTVRQPARLMGQYAAQRLLAQLRGSGTFEDYTFEPELVVRKSTGAPQEG